MSSQNALVDRRVLGPCYKCTPRVASTSLECERARVHIMDCAGGAAGACARAAGRQDKWLVRPPLETLSRHGRVLRCFSWKCGTARWAAPRGASSSTPTIGLSAGRQRSTGCGLEWLANCDHEGEVEVEVEGEGEGEGEAWRGKRKSGRRATVQGSDEILRSERWGGRQCAADAPAYSPPPCVRVFAA